jgi:hypothetical protein
MKAVLICDMLHVATGLLNICRLRDADESVLEEGRKE